MISASTAAIRVDGLDRLRRGGHWANCVFCFCRFSRDWEVADCGVVRGDRIGRVLRHTHWVLLLMLAVGPFNDLVRAVLFPNTALVGAWQDIAVIGFGIAAIRNIRCPDFKWRFSYLDCAVVANIAAYAFSALLTSNLAVWFYCFRWETLYALFYLALKTFRFTDRELKRIVSVTAGALVASIMIGYWMITMLGNQAYFALLGALGFTVFLDAQANSAGQELSVVHWWRARRLAFCSSLAALASFKKKRQACAGCIRASQSWL